MADVMVMREIHEKVSELGINLFEILFNSIQLPTGEDFGIEIDDKDAYDEDNLEFEAGYGSIIVVDNLLVVPQEKFETLESVIRKIYNQMGVIKENGLWIPADPDTKKTLGYCFVEYNAHPEAELTKEKTNGYRLDRAHIFAVSMFDDFDRFMKVPD